MIGDVVLGLNDMQRQAVEAGYGPVLIVAGPGTGKTKALTARIAYLLATKQVPASEILALTFTVKAAREMKDRVLGLIGDETNLPHISTFHAHGHEILRTQRRAQKLKFITDAERLDIIRSLPKPSKLKGVSVRELALHISRAKGSLQGHDAANSLVRSYNDSLRLRGLVDFDDLLAQTHTLLKDNAQIRAQQQKYRYVLIDEFQDTSELQWAIVKLLLVNDNLFVIGDPNQSIYSFRGAGDDMFKRFAADFPDHRKVTLTTNYRSKQSIVKLTNAIFPMSAPLKADSSEEGDVSALQTLNEYSEADLALATIEQGIGGNDFLKAQVNSEGRRFKDFAILYRTHRAVMTVKRRLQESGMPTHLTVNETRYS